MAYPVYGSMFDTPGGSRISCMRSFLFATIVLAQMTHRETPHGIEACLEARRQLLYHSNVLVLRKLSCTR